MESVLTHPRVSLPAVIREPQPGLAALVILLCCLVEAAIAVHSRMSPQQPRTSFVPDSSEVLMPFVFCKVNSLKIYVLWFIVLYPSFPLLLL